MVLDKMLAPENATFGAQSSAPRDMMTFVIVSLSGKGLALAGLFLF
jgi:hypothetical protein